VAAGPPTPVGIREAHAVSQGPRPASRGAQAMARKWWAANAELLSARCALGQLLAEVKRSRMARAVFFASYMASSA